MLAIRLVLPACFFQLGGHLDVWVSVLRKLDLSGSWWAVLRSPGAASRPDMDLVRLRVKIHGCGRLLFRSNRGGSGEQGDFFGRS